MAKRTCSIDGCVRDQLARGWCPTHYRRWRLYGSPTGSAPVPDRETRFDSHVDRRPDGCWLWTASTKGNGYGQFNDGRTMVWAHRWSYERHVGPIPDGLELDHLCRVRHCVNPDHLEPVTHRVNTLRGSAPTAVNARKTHCIRGHAFDSINTYVRPNGNRMCLACQRHRRRRIVQPAVRTHV